jgi:purine-nucleoside phosphorylase
MAKTSLLQAATKTKIGSAAKRVRDITKVVSHPIAVVAGSGWTGAINLLGATVAEIPADEVPGFSASGIPGHTGTIRSVRLPNGKHALVLGARTHFYEDKGVRAVAHGVRVAAACGAKIMVLTNGAGGIKESWSPGTPVLISDHINLTAASPLE